MSINFIILKKAELFFSLAINDIEKTRAARKKWFANLKEKAKINPNDPDYQKYLAYRKQQYDLHQQVLDTDEEALNKYLDSLKERQQKFISKLKQDPEKYEAHLQKKKIKDEERSKQMKNTDLEGKVLLLARNLASKKNGDRKKFERKPFAEYENNKKLYNEVSEYLIKLRAFMYGSKQDKTLPNLEFLIILGQNIQNSLRPIAPSLSNDVNNVLDLLDIQLSQYKSHGIFT